MTIDTITKSPTPTELVKKVNELVEGLNDGRASSIPVGHIYTVGYSELDAGQLPLLGGEYSRTTYADLWAWVQSKPSLLKTESEWQTLKAASGNKGVPYYSAGNGTTTFRVPMFGCYVKGSSNIGDVGGFLAAGLPNITGANVLWYGDSPTGAFSSGSGGGGGFGQGPYNILGASIDASKSSAIYGNSTTVTPDSTIQLYVVQAFGEVTNVGSTDVAAIAVGLQELETSLGEVNIQAGLYSTITTASQKWAVEYFTDKSKTNRVWCRQGGFNKSTSTGVGTITVSFLTPFFDLDSLVVNRSNLSAYSGSISIQDAWFGIISLSTTGLSFKTDLTNQPKAFWIVEGN